MKQAGITNICFSSGLIHCNSVSLKCMLKLLYNLETCISPTYNVLRHMYIVLPDDLAKGKRLVGGIVPVVTVVVVDPVVIVVAGVV